MYKPSTYHLPSFSSSLLDHIYRSIDEQQLDHPTPIVYTKTKNKVKLNNDFKTSSHRSFNSSSTSSYFFSSPDTESIHGFVSRPKPIRTSFNRYHDEYIRNEKQINMYNRMYQFEELQLKHKHGSELVKNNTNSRAMKLYADLKKVKQPISPGGRLATFFNSPRGRRSMYGEELNLHAVKFVKKHSNDAFRVYSSEKISTTEEDRWSFRKNYPKKIECEFDFIRGKNEIDLKYEVDDDEDDAASHTSSDLFELENFSGIGMEKHGDELPVFETTHLNKKLAIGNIGFFM